MKKVIFILFAALAVASCGKGAKIKGHLASGNQKDTIYLESVMPAGKKVIDSVVTQNGKFSFAVKLSDGQTAIYNIRSGQNVVPLILSPGETARIKGVGNVARNYTVSGSGASEQVRELTMILNEGAAKLDSLTNIYTHLDAGDTMRRHVTRQYARTYFDTKQAQIRFIVTNPGTLAAMYGLYQRLPNDNTLFNSNMSDVVYYRLVADSLEVYFPASPYLKALKADIGRMSLDGMLMNPDALTAVKYPDIDLPDMYGKKHKLSAMDGKVILIDFWAATVPQCRLLNAELKEIYSRLHDRGFEVYQVSLDTTKALWVNLVQEQKLPWTTVCDFRGQATQPVGLYNVTSIPANFLLDRQGNLVGKNLYGKELETKVKSLL